jgi:hypothetical protein
MLRSKSTLFIVACGVATALMLGGCGGGGGGSSPGGGTSAAVQNVSGSLQLFDAAASLPTSIYTNESVLIIFQPGSQIDPAPLGGFFSAVPGGPPQVFQASVPSVTGFADYFAFANQTAARDAVRVYRNVAGPNQIPGYIVGRLVNNPNIVVIDPVIPSTNPFGLATQDNWPINPNPTDPTNAYVLNIPAASALAMGGISVPAFPPGATSSFPFNLPVPFQPAGTTGIVPTGWFVSTAQAPDPIPPQIISVEPEGGEAGTPADPMPANSNLHITFSKKISFATIDFLKNLVVRNLDVLVNGQPALVPGTMVPFDPTLGLPCDPNTPAGDSKVFCFIPSPSFGPGVSATEGFDIEIKIGFNTDPNEAIRGIPQGPTATQLPLSNSLLVVLRTAPCTIGNPGCSPTVATVTEGFDDAAKLDTSFVAPFGTCRWNASTALGQLTGRAMTGSASTFIPGVTLGRAQFVVDPQPAGTGGLFSPFDASAAQTTACMANCGGPCNVGVNPNGGSHIMHLYEATEMGSTKDSLELVEWSPVGQLVTPSTYPTMSIWAGVTSVVAPITSVAGSCPGAGANQCGLNSAYGANYGPTGGVGTPLLPFQQNDPTVSEDAYAGYNGVPQPPPPTAPDRIRVFGPANYVANSNFGQFYGYPLFTTPFDLAQANGAGGTGTNLLLEMNIEPGNQCPNFHRFRATFSTPARRLLGPPISAIAPGALHTASGGAGFDIYRMRFTFVGRRSSARSLWYDTGSNAPIYQNVILNPSPVPGVGQPDGTTTIWKLDGKAGPPPLPSPSALPTTADNIVFDATGAFQLGALTNLTVTSSRFFRFRVDMLGNASTNAVPTFNNLIMVFQL